MRQVGHRSGGNEERSEHAGGGNRAGQLCDHLTLSPSGQEPTSGQAGRAAHTLVCIQASRTNWPPGGSKRCRGPVVDNTTRVVPLATSMVRISVPPLPVYNPVM